MATAQQEVVDISKFLYLADASECNMEHITTMSHIVTYLNALRESGVGPSGQITKLTTVMDAMKMLISKVPDDGLTVFNDNTVEYIHYSALKQNHPFLYYRFLK